MTGPDDSTTEVAARTLEAKVAWLSDPASYPDRPATVERIQTHFAWVFLAGARAYKLKKPRKLDGADLGSLAAREWCCREEVRLNRRLAAETYLGVEPLTVRGDGFELGGDGPVADWLVAMRRLDRAQMLDARLAAGTVAVADLEAVVERLLVLDAESDGPHGVEPATFDAAVRARLEEALGETARPGFAVPRAALAPAAARLRALHDAARPALVARAPRVREGHGDLRAEHVWLGPPLQVIDALEFDRALRMLDPAEDVAMLAVDAERLAGAWTREALCRAYEARARDPVAPVLWGFYLALRAATRAKIAIWHLADPGHAAEAERWRATCVDWLRLCAGYGSTG